MVSNLETIDTKKQIQRSDIRPGSLYVDEGVMSMSTDGWTM